MSLVGRLREWLAPRVVEPGVSTPDELREAEELQAENRRHIAAIELHVEEVSDRIRSDVAEDLREADRGRRK